MRKTLAGMILATVLLLAGCTLAVQPAGTPTGETPAATTPTTETPSVETSTVETSTVETSTVETSTPETPTAPITPSETIDPALLGITWQWVRTEQSDGTFVEALDPSRYTLTFMADGRVDVQFDCNSGFGSYTVEGDSLTFGKLGSTLMACLDESQADLFGQQLAEVARYTVTSDAVTGDTLTLTLADGGTMTFSPQE